MDEDEAREAFRPGARFVRAMQEPTIALSAAALGCRVARLAGGWLG
jgi:hypothetical protein